MKSSDVAIHKRLQMIEMRIHIFQVGDSQVVVLGSPIDSVNEEYMASVGPLICGNASISEFGHSVENLQISSAGYIMWMKLSEEVPFEKQCLQKWKQEIWMFSAYGRQVAYLPWFKTKTWPP